MSDPSLARVAGDFITYVQLLGQAPPEHMPLASAVRSQLLTLLEPVSKGVHTDGIASEELEEARFALVAWADETLLRREWPGRHEWQGETLQMQLYRTSRAGNEFFEHLARLRPEQNAAREIYFMALVLGFEGQYAGQQAERQAVINHQFGALQAGGRAVEAAQEVPLTPSAYDVEIELPAGGGRGILGWLGLMALGLVAVYVVLWVVLYFATGEVPVPRGL